MSSDRVRFLEAATRIGRRLCRDAIWADGRCNWLGWTNEPGVKQALPIYRAMGPLLHDGTAGIGLFLTWLAYFTHDQIVRATAVGAFAHALAAVDGLADAGEYGFYSGLSGIAWCCAESGTLLEDEQLAVRGQAAISRTARIAPHPQRLSVFNGSAGLIHVLCTRTEDEACEELLAAAVRHGDHLLSRAVETEQGWSWDSPREHPLLGFAQGTSGIAAALITLAWRSGREDFVVAAEQALRHERNYFRPAGSNSPDLPCLIKLGGEPADALSWCRGVPGIGFARLLMHRLFPDDAGFLNEAEAAIATTAAAVAPTAPGVGNFSLCRGDAGNADLLILAADLLARPDLRCIAETAASSAIEQFEEAALPWPCGGPGGVEIPNLLLGLSGIGYCLLRLYDSRAVPTVLLPAAGGTLKRF